MCPSVCVSVRLCSLDKMSTKNAYFSEAAIKYDEECVQQVATFIQERFNPFEVREAAAISNITNSQIDQERALFLLHSVEKGESARDDLYKYRLQGKTIKLFDKIPLMWESTKNVSSSSSSTSKFDLKK